MITAGVDSGSRAIKAVVLDQVAGRILGTAACDSQVDAVAASSACLAEACRAAGLAVGDLGAICATGYARAVVAEARLRLTEITCHARGVLYRLPGCRSVIEVGGQDSKVIRMAGSRVADFAMNDRCAAGTGRFLELLATRMGVGLPELGGLMAASRSPAAISSMCVVFAESEIIGLLAQGTAREDIVAGVVAAVCSRVAALAGDALVEPIAFTGGVARIGGVPDLLGRTLGHRILVPEDPHLTGALGAALLAAGK